MVSILYCPRKLLPIGKKKDHLGSIPLYSPTEGYKIVLSLLQWSPYVVPSSFPTLEEPRTPTHRTQHAQCYHSQCKNYFRRLLLEGSLFRRTNKKHGSF